MPRFSILSLRSEDGRGERMMCEYIEVKDDYVKRRDVLALEKEIGYGGCKSRVIMAEAVYELKGYTLTEDTEAAVRRALNAVTKASSTIGFALVEFMKLLMERAEEVTE